MNKADCIFCQIVAGNIPSTPVYQDEDFIVIPDIHPAAPVHFLVIPKKHVQDFMRADEELLVKMQKIMRKIIQTHGIKDFRLVHNGEGAAVIAHLHVHVMGQVDKNRNL